LVSGREHRADDRHDDVERLGVERQTLGVGLNPLELQPGGVRTAPAGAEQLGRQVAGGHSRAGARGSQRRVARAGGDVEHPHPGADARRSDEPRAERQQERLDHGRVVARGPHSAVARLQLGIRNGGGHLDLLSRSAGPDDRTLRRGYGCPVALHIGSRPQLWGRAP